MSARWQLLCCALWLGIGACSAREEPASGSQPPEPAFPDARDPVGPVPTQAVATEDVGFRVPEPTAPVELAAASRAHRATQMDILGQPLKRSALVQHVPLQRPQALRPLYRALAELERNGLEGRDKVRIAVYGSSSVAADRYTGYLRRYLQHRFGDGGPGFVALVPLWRWHRHQEASVEASRSWRVEHALKRRRRLDGRYGLLGASAYSRYGGARIHLELDRAEPVSLVELWYLQQPGGGTLNVFSHGGKEAQFSTHAEAIGPGYRVLEPGKRSELWLRTHGRGEVRVFGAVLERDGPGVVVDELGIGGTEAADHLTWELPLWADNIHRRDPVMYVLAYGANAAGMDDLPMPEYRRQLDEVLVRFRETLPEAACLLVGPQDFYAKDGRGDRRVEPRVTPVVRIQRELSAEHGCAFWDTRAFMGGEGSMRRWVHADLARHDHLHFTPEGYAHMGATLSDALLAPFDAAQGDDGSW